VLEQVANALPCVAQFTSGGTGAASLTVTCTVYKWGGSSWSTVVSSQSATEIGEGFYSYQLSSGSNDGEGLYLFVFSTAGTADLKKIGAGWAVSKAGIENLDATIATRATQTSLDTLDDYVDSEVSAIKTKTDQLTFTTANRVDASPNSSGIWTYATRTLTDITGETTITSPVGTGGQLTLVRGDDYYVADGTELTFTRDSWPNLTGATSITLTVRARSDDSLTFAVTDSTGSRVVGAGDQTVVFQLASTDTELLTPGRLTGKYDVQAVLSNGHICTLEVTDPPNSYGGVTVLEDQTR
jgi:hypothetical protein